VFDEADDGCHCRYGDAPLVTGIQANRHEEMIFLVDEYSNDQL
jgi:hypothetical protein